MAADSFFGVIDSISSNLTTQLATISNKLSGGTLSHEILLIMLAAEILLVLVLMLSGGGAQAVSRGVEAILYGAFIFALTSAGSWNSIIIPLSTSFPDDIIAELGVASDPQTLKADVTAQFAQLISGLMNPSNIQPSARLAMPK